MRKKSVFTGSIIIFLVIFVQCSVDQTETLSSEMTRELALLPSPTTGLGYLNIKAVKESPFFSMVQDNLEENPFYSDDYQEFIDATGLDIRRDIDEIYISLNPEPEDEDPDLFVLIKGTYQSEKIMAYIMEKSEDEGEEITSESYAQKTIYNLPEEEFSLCFANNNRLLFGKKEQIKSWLDNLSGNKDAMVSTDLKKRIQTVKYKGEGWLSIDARTMVAQMMNKINQHTSERRFEALESLQDMNASVKFDEKMKFHGIGHFSDGEKAQLFYDALKGLIATAKLSISKDRKAVDVLNKIDTHIKGTEIEIEFEMSKEDIDRLKMEKERIAII